MNTQRNIVVHYHLFKNAGTSVDHLLRKNFPDKWHSFDGNSAGDIINTEELEGVIAAKAEMLAFSSHQIIPPLPVGDFTVYPIVFLRDPIDRIKSAYLFEWKKQLGLDTPKGSLKQFVERKFSKVRKSSVEEFQVLRLSNTNSDRFSNGGVSDEELTDKACAFIESLDFVGIVDRFDESNNLLQNFLRPAFPDFEIHDVQANVLQDISISQERKRQIIREELGEELFEMIVDRNRLDQKLYQFGKNHFQNLLNFEQAKIEKTA